MPPKGPARGSTRGRGRGRGRGGSSRSTGEGASPAESVAEAQASSTSEPVEVPTSTSAAPTSSDTPADNEPAPALAAISTAAGTQTSASTARAVATSRATPSSSSASTPAPSRGGTTARASKFRPKAVRRGEAERERIAQEQLADLNKRLAQEAREQARLNRLHGRGRGRGRGRGGADGMKREVGGFASHPDFNRTKLLRGPQSADPSGSSNNKGLTGVKKDEEAVLPDPDDPRINADAMYGLTIDSEPEDNGVLESTNKKHTLRPLGTLRFEHKEEKIVVSSSREIEAQDQGEDEGEIVDDSSDTMMIDEDLDMKTTKDEKVEAKAESKTRGVAKIKRESGSGVDKMDIDESPAGNAIKAAPDSPDQKRKKALVLGGEKTETAQKRKAFKDPEREREAQQLAYQLSMLSVRAVEQEQDGTVESHGDTSHLENHLYLWQFPPILPPLNVVKPEPTQFKVKDEPNDDVVMLKPAPGTSTNIDLTGDEDGKKEGDDEADKDQDKGPAAVKEGGFLGKLLVRKSGKVELSWGGYTLDMMPGIETQFLTSAALLEETDLKPSTTSDELYSGMAYGMGQIRGKFVFAPRFGEEEEWVVDPNDLEIPLDEY